MKNLFKLTTLAVTLSFAANLANANEKIGFADTGYLLKNHPTVIEANQKLESALKEIEKKYADENQKLVDEEKALVNERNKIDADAQKLLKEQDAVEASIKKKTTALEKDAPRLRSKEIQARQDAINNELKAFQNKVSAIQKREGELNTKADALQKKIKAFQEKLAKEEQNINVADANEVQKVAVSDIDKAIKTLAEQKGYTLILSPTVAFYAKDEKADITEEVLANVKANAKPLAELPKTEKASETQAK